MATVVHLDTHVVVWLFAGMKQRIPPNVADALERNALAISPMVELELEYLHEIGRLKDPSGVVVRDLGHRIGLEVAAGSFGAVAGAATRFKWTRDPFDRMIVAHAEVQQASLVTADVAIRREYPRTLWA